VACVAGIALFGTIGNSLASALAVERDREAALVTFLVTASGVSLAGIGSAFWGLVAGALCLLVLRPRRPDTGYPGEWRCRRCLSATRDDEAMATTLVPPRSSSLRSRASSSPVTARAWAIRRWQCARYQRLAKMRR
jgi:hypothetical protein